MKNKLIKILTTIFCLTFVLFGYILGGKAEFNRSASALSFYASQEAKNKTGHAIEDETSETNNEESTPFLVDPTIMENKGDFVYVYDNADSSLKVIDKKTAEFRAENTVLKTKFVPTDILIVDKYILLINTITSQIQCVLSSDFSEYEVDATLIVKIENAFKILVVNVAGQDQILICPENPIANNLHLIALEKDQNENRLQIKSETEFKISNRYDSFASYENIFACEYNGNLFLILFNNNTMLSFEYDMATKPEEITLSRAVNGFDQMDKLSDFGAITFENGEKMFAIELENSIKFYSLNISTTRTDLTYIENKDIAIDENFALTHLCADQNTFALLSSALQQVKIYTFTGSFTDFNIQTQTKKNPNIENVFWTDYDKFVYVKATTNINLFDFPYSKTQIVQIPEDKTMTIIGEGKISDGDAIKGYYFVMFSTSDTNFYGYVRSSQVSQLEKSTYSSLKVTVLTNTALLKMPSFVRDSINTEIMLLKATADVSVAEGESGLYSFSSMGTKFLRVIVKDGDNSYEGFIDASRARPRTVKGERVITNASIKKNNSEVFTSEDNTSEIITLLDKGARVRVEGKRNTKTNLTKISFNDNAGNKHTGYVYNYNLQTDTWTMLQILGMTLVVVNTILLVVIICIKNKVTK